MRKMLGRTLAGASVTAMLTISTAQLASAAEAPDASPSAGAPIYALPGLDGLTTTLGPAAETGKLTDIAPGGAPVFGLVDSALGAPGKLGLPSIPGLSALPNLPGLGG